MASTSRTSGDNLASVFAGGFAGVCSTCVTNPLDTIRVRLSAGRGATGKAHKSLRLTARELFSEGLFHAFSRGLGANIMASMPSNAVYLPTYRFLQHELAGLGVSEQVRPMLCAFGAVTATNMMLSPLFVIRTRVQVDDRLTIRHVFRDVLRRDGVRGLYRGTATNIAGRFVEEGCFWTVYELLKRLTHAGQLGERDFLWASAAMVSLTMMAKLAAVSVSYPYNVIMNHLRTVNKVTGRHDHVRVWPTVRHIYAADGILGFYKGLAPQILRSVMSKATQIYAFELALFTYAQMRHRQPPPVPAEERVIAGAAEPNSTVAACR
ncbi:mitochondrial carrier protein [Novymonas esmeraldas]|uniref:Mitochondrial carrier protein n=1 Tax=Novymonas esmeraldas TaxID=1808958 RepID=A0AAW0ETU8_9TRYP